MTKKSARSRRAKSPKEKPVDLEGPPPREATVLHSDAERRFEEELAEHQETSPRLTAGDVDADWQRAHIDGEEAPGGTVATPDQSVVEEIGDALGVPRSPNEEVRSSAEILDERDRERWKQEQP